MTQLTAEHLRKVASVYTEASDALKPPVKAVGVAFNVPDRTASYWVKRSRELGLISVEKYRNAKVQRVADALGVSYQALEAALIAEADGDIRLGFRSIRESA